MLRAGDAFGAASGRGSAYNCGGSCSITSIALSEVTIARALVVTGSGRYADGIHQFERTSTAVGALLADAGVKVDHTRNVDHAMTKLHYFDLLVINAGDPWRGSNAELGVDPTSVTGLHRALQRGIGVIALHAAVASLRDYPEWPVALGALWLPGVSGHPPFGRVSVRIDQPEHPVADDVGDFEVDDEQYQHLQFTQRVTPIASAQAVDAQGADASKHGSASPVVWGTQYGRSRIVYDALGHDVRSLNTDAHRQLLLNAADWVLD